jgi:hypothetical protein
MRQKNMHQFWATTMSLHRWYENTYALFDKRYEINQKKFSNENKKKSKFTSKIKSLLKLDE